MPNSSTDPPVPPDARRKLPRRAVIVSSLVAVILVAVVILRETDLRWGYIITEVLFSWLKCGCVWFAYAFAKHCTTRDTSSPEKVSAKEKFVCYTKCVGVIAGIALLSCAKTSATTSLLSLVQTTTGVR
jgi:hypothetical protein